MYHVVDMLTGRIIRSFHYRRWAERNIDAMVAGARYNRWTRESLEVMTDEEYNSRKEEIDPLVEVKNMMSGKPVMIRKSQVGTCVDPSTETYWSM